MVIYSRLLKTSGIGSVAFDDAESLQLTLTNSDNNTASMFTAKIPNQYGYHKTDFNIGDEVTIYADKNINPPTTAMFKGLVENITFADQGQVKNTITIAGRDYSSILQNATVEPTVFNDLDAGSIVASLVSEFCSGLTIGSVDIVSGFNVKHIGFNHTPVFDAITQMAGYSDYQFFVDAQKNVNFKPRGTIINNYTIGSANVISASFQNNNRKIANQIWVYGDRVLSAAPTETFTSDGAGSVITLAYKPHNIEVAASGTGIVKGTIFHLNSTPSSGTAYMVDYDTQTLIWISGTDLGNNIPGSLIVSTVRYDRSLPIIKLIQDDASVAEFGKFTKVINDRNIKDPRQAEDLARSQLYELAYPKEQGNIKLQGVALLMPNTQVPVYLPYHNISGNYNIFQVAYDFNKSNNLSESVMTINVGEKIPDVTDTLKQAILELRQLQTSDFTSTDILTRMQTSTGSIGNSTNFKIYTRGIGSSFVLGNPNNAVLGTNRLGSSGLGVFAVVSSGGIW